MINDIKRNYNNCATTTVNISGNGISATTNNIGSQSIVLNASGYHSSIVYNSATRLSNLVLNSSGPYSSIVYNGGAGLNGNNQSNPPSTINELDSVASGTTSQNPNFYQNNHWKSKNDNPNCKWYTGK